MKIARIIAILLALILVLTGCTVTVTTDETEPRLPNSTGKELPPSYLYTVKEVGSETRLSKHLESGETVSTERIDGVKSAVQSVESDTIYYTDKSGSLRLRTNDGQEKELVKTDDGSFKIGGGKIYFIEDSSLTSTTLTAASKKTIVPHCKKLLGVVSGSIYYKSSDKGGIFEYNVKTEASRQITTDDSAEFKAIVGEQMICTEKIGDKYNAELIDLRGGTVQNLLLPTDKFVVSGEDVYFSDPENSGFFSSISKKGEAKRVICEKPAQNLVLIGGRLYFSSDNKTNYTRYDVKTGQLTELPADFDGTIVIPLERQESAGTAAKSAKK